MEKKILFGARPWSSLSLILTEIWHSTLDIRCEIASFTLWIGGIFSSTEGNKDQSKYFDTTWLKCVLGSVDLLKLYNEPLILDNNTVAVTYFPLFWTKGLYFFLILLLKFSVAKSKLHNGLFLGQNLSSRNLTYSDEAKDRAKYAQNSALAFIESFHKFQLCRVTR